MSVLQSCMFLSWDRVDIAYATKELAWFNTSPTKGHLAALRCRAGYIKEHMRMINAFEWKYTDTTIEVFSASDWASCKVTRKSTSGGIATIGKGIIKSWATTQPFITRSSCEAELIAATKAGAEGLGLKQLCHDFNFGLKAPSKKSCHRPRRMSTLWNPVAYK